MTINVFLALNFLVSIQSDRKNCLLEKTAHVIGALARSGPLKRMPPSFLRFTNDEKSLTLMSRPLNSV